MKCKEKSCLNSPEPGHDMCKAHGGTPPKVVIGVSEPQVITMAEVPKSARFNEQSMKLLKRIRSLQTGAALKFETKHYSLATLTAAKRYALEENLRIGTRICGDFGYAWKLTEEEIKAVEVKANRLKAGREKKKRN